MDAHKSASRKWGKWNNRYWSRIAVRGPDECWIWRPDVRVLKSRYGTIYFNGKNMRPHRLAYILAHGTIPNGMEVCHQCDNPRCNNPRHLFLGTHRVNMLDAAAKQRLHVLHGTKHPEAKLTETIVIDARKLAQSGISKVALAKRYGVTKSTMTAAINGKSWTHI